MTTEVQETLVGICMFAALFGILYVFFQTRHRERMLMIEKGADASLFQRKLSRHHTLRFGMFLIGIALGILLGNILEATTRLEDGVAYFSMIFLFGGASLVLFHVYFKDKSNGS